MFLEDYFLLKTMGCKKMAALEAFLPLSARLSSGPVTFNRLAVPYFTNISRDAKRKCGKRALVGNGATGC